MRKLLALLAAGAMFAAAPASAVTVVNVDASTGSLGTVVTEAPGLFEADLELLTGGSVSFDLIYGADDQGVVEFNAFVDFFTSVGISQLLVTLTGDPDTVFGPAGDLTGAFSFPVATFAPDGRQLVVAIKGGPEPDALPGLEFVSLSLGDAGQGGDNFSINLGGLPSGAFTITFQAVPAPASLTLFGLGAIGLLAARRGGGERR